MSIRKVEAYSASGMTSSVSQKHLESDKKVVLERMNSLNRFDRKAAPKKEN